jgi:hypothetical protein
MDDILDRVKRGKRGKGEKGNKSSFMAKKARNPERLLQNISSLRPPRLGGEFPH